MSLFFSSPGLYYIPFDTHDYIIPASATYARLTDEPLQTGAFARASITGTISIAAMMRTGVAEADVYGGPKTGWNRRRFPPRPMGQCLAQGPQNSPVNFLTHIPQRNGNSGSIRGAIHEITTNIITIRFPRFSGRLPTWVPVDGLGVEARDSEVQIQSSGISGATVRKAHKNRRTSESFSAPLVIDPVPNYPDILPMAILLFMQFYMDHCALPIKYRRICAVNCRAPCRPAILDPKFPFTSQAYI
ncbi:hypothetical protein B0H13DRAFT_1894580 [Mycena leptocephala]|nr:hypothetical protein B0H13DRAFT_1894580 [Mycena leptocephala]